MVSVTPVDLSAVDAAIETARRGLPTLLVIEGAQGTGKSTLLSATVKRASGFGSLAGEAVEGDLDPYSTLARMGVVVPRLASPLVAAQSIRDRLDAVTPQPFAIVTVDDVQWADRETLQALVQLLESSDGGDPLLVAVASHTLSSDARAAVDSRVQAGRAHRILLGDWTLEQAKEVAAHSRPLISEQTVERTWRMTQGNPLYFSSIVEEYEPAEVDRMSFLPAPEAFARAVAHRLDRLGPDPSAVMRVCAILGGEWSPVATVAATAGVHEPIPAVQSLLDAGLIEHRPAPELGGLIRPVHALVRAAVYQRIDLEGRRDLHLAAAAVESDMNAVLGHRVAAATSFDAALAAELDDTARRNHAAGAFRRAGEQLRWASRLTQDPRLRRERLLDGLFEQVFAGDPARISEELARVDNAGDDRVALIAAAQAVFENRWRDAVGLLEPVLARLDESVDALLRFRCEVFGAWAGVGMGAPTEWIAQRVERARAAGVVDPAMRGFLAIVEVQLSGRESDMAGFRQRTAWLPQHPAEAPLEASHELLMRGSAYAASGDGAAAQADLLEVERRFHLGVLDVGDGVTHAYLGFAYWLQGEWRLAEVKFRIARGMLRAIANPLTSSLCALGLVGAGEFAKADELLNDARARLVRQPWPEAVYWYSVVLGVRLHAGGDEAAQATALDALEDDLGMPLQQVDAPAFALWLVYRTLFSVWASRLDEAESFIGRMRGLEGERAWFYAAADWLQGLIAKRRGEPARARRYFDDALSGGIHGIPLLEAHVLVDRARVSGDPVYRDGALAIYRTIGQLPYIRRLSVDPTDPADSVGLADPADPADPAGPARSEEAARRAILGSLSDRERDVMTLITSGLSYGQVARDLFISRSTVSFHLGNIYAKTGVNSRHALTDLVRSAS